LSRPAFDDDRSRKESTAPCELRRGVDPTIAGLDFVHGGLSGAFRYTATGGFEFLGQIAA
jgi:hypothetical protein